MIDALSGLGHACGHNLIAVSSMAAALATAYVVAEEKLGGKVVLFGTPAEGESFLFAVLLKKHPEDSPVPVSADSSCPEAGGSTESK